LLYKFGALIASLVNKKAKMWQNGRRNIFENILNWRSTISENQKIIWMHCASLGEFEQGRPILENIKAKYPKYKILLTFFSPSGYEIRKNYTGADAVFYLPLDGKKNAEKFIDVVKPSVVIWVKYEYWYHYLTCLKNKNIPVFLISAIFRANQPFFKWYGAFWKKILYCFSHIFVQNKESISLLNSIGIDKNLSVAGDTRFDRVIDIANQQNTLPDSISSFCSNAKVIVAGSTWQDDEEELVHYAKTNPQIKFIIAPHEISTERIAEVEAIFKNSVTLSQLNSNNNKVQVLIIDNIGLLSQLYRIATIAYIGGGFNSSGIHNILEAAVYGKPIIFGPVYEKFAEAKSLVNLNAAFSFENALELEQLLDTLFNNNELYNKAAITSKNYVFNMQGATNNIVQLLYEKRLLINE
jgi:3-deoxy-D-manno-octulosonic-acid transferase